MALSNYLKSQTIAILLIHFGIQLSCGEISVGLMLAPICEAKCLNSFNTNVIGKTKLNSTSNSTNSMSLSRYQPFLIKTFCSSNDACQSCMSACDNPENSNSDCINKCQLTAESKESSKICIASCQFIEDTKRRRPGSCMSKDYARNNQPIRCTYSCNSDVDCYKIGTKCCFSTACGQTCQIAQLPVKNVPPIPKQIIVNQTTNSETSEMNLDLDWSNYELDTLPYPVIFEVQMRSGRANKPKTDVYGSWRHILTTTKTGLILTELNLETWYQFRLIAINENGYAGVSPPTKPITVAYSKPIVPPRIKNIFEQKSSIINGHISVNIYWTTEKPIENVNNRLPINGYKITWRRANLDNQNNALVKEYYITVPGTQTYYTIEKLMPSTTYIVSIISFIKYRNSVHNSTNAIQYITTPDLPKSKININNMEYKYLKKQLDSSTNNCACDSTSDLLPVDIGPFSLDKSQLKSKIKLKDSLEIMNSYAPYTFYIKYSPIVCIDSGIHYAIPTKPKSIVANNNINHIISDLKFRCNYQLQVDLFSDVVKKTMKVWKGCFCTPNCAAEIETGNKESCIYDQNSMTIPPPPPYDIRISIEDNEASNKATAHISWSSVHHSQISKFLVIWGPRIEEPLDEYMYSKDLVPLLDSASAISKIINYPVHTVSLDNLERDKIYVVKLQSIGNNIISKDSITYFQVNSLTGQTKGVPSLSGCSPIQYFVLFMSFMYLYLHTNC